MGFGTLTPKNQTLQRRQKLYSANLNPIETIYWLLEDAKRYGTLPCRVSLAGFLAVQMLRSCGRRSLPRKIMTISYRAVHRKWTTHDIGRL